jgi:HEPN domain-containing protein
VGPEEFDVGRVTAFWLTEAEEALRVADHLVEKGDYSYALFFGHLAIEKLLKALYAARHHEHAPPIHNLVRLAKAAGIDLGESQADSLVTITAFNVEARYPDMKRSFRQMCTAEYAGRQMESVKGIFAWLRSQIR